jgi:hypothetical protein
VHSQLIGKADIVGLELLDGVGLRVGEQDAGEALARGRVGLVVDAGDARAERAREGRLDVRDGHLVENDRL